MYKKNIYIFGAGSLGINFYINNSTKFNLISFIDNNKELYNKFIFNKKISPPDILKKNDFDYIIIASDWHKEIHQELTEIYFLDRRKILLFSDFTEKYPLNKLDKLLNKIKKKFLYYQFFYLCSQKGTTNLKRYYGSTRHIILVKAA